jgi:hypothetical protein
MNAVRLQALHTTFKKKPGQTILSIRWKALELAQLTMKLNYYCGLKAILTN